MATYGEIVHAINELPKEEREDVLLSLVVGLSLAANAYSATALNNDTATSDYNTSGRTVKDLSDAYKEASEAAEATFNSVKIKAKVGI